MVSNVAAVLGSAGPQPTQVYTCVVIGSEEGFQCRVTFFNEGTPHGELREFERICSIREGLPV